MTPQQLKNSILQLAIEGKLVEQNAEDGNSKELLEELLKDAEEFNKNKGRSDCNKFLNTNEYDMPFSLPSNWCWVRLGDICSIARGGSPRPIKDYITNDPNGINWIKIGDTNKDDKYINKAAEKIKPVGIKKSRFVYPGDFLLTNSMSFGRPYILNIEGCIHDGWLVISQYEKLFDKNFLFWVLSSRFAYEQFCKKVSGAVVKNLNIDKVANSIFPVPPISEQVRIVEKIEKIFSLIELYAVKWKKLIAINQKFPDDLQKSILQYALQGKICNQIEEDGSGSDLIKQIIKEKERLIEIGLIKKQKILPPIRDDEIPFEIPKTWRWSRLSECIDVRDGTHETPKYVLKGIPLVTSKNLVNGEIDFSTCKEISLEDHLKFSERSKVEANDILFAMIGSIGNPVLVSETNVFSIKNMALFKNTYRNINMKFLFWFLYYSQEMMKRNASGGVQAFVSLTFLRSFLFPLPPIAEQNRIVKKIDSIMLIINGYKKFLSKVIT